MNLRLLHPEELLDRDERGELDPRQRAQLEQHLDRCAACRAERRLRADFVHERRNVPLYTTAMIDAALERADAALQPEHGASSVRPPERRAQGLWSVLRGLGAALIGVHEVAVDRDETTAAR